MGLSLDFEIFHWINQGLASPWMDFWLVPWRNTLVWVPLFVGMIAFYVFNFPKLWYMLILITIATVSTSDIVSSHLIKKSVQRLRPCNDVRHEQQIIERVRCGSGYSFTSSHATNHMALGTFWFFLFGPLMGYWRWLWIFWGLSIGFAQIYVGVHYPSDVLAGSIIGCWIGFGWFYLGRNYFFKNYLVDSRWNQIS